MSISTSTKQSKYYLVQYITCFESNAKILAWIYRWSTAFVLANFRALYRKTQILYTRSCSLRVLHFPADRGLRGFCYLIFATECLKLPRLTYHQKWCVNTFVLYTSKRRLRFENHFKATIYSIYIHISILSEES